MSVAPGAFVPLPYLDDLDEDEAIAALAPLFEGAPAFLARLVAKRPFNDTDVLFAQARAIAHLMPEAEQLELVDAHPRLGAPPGSVSALSYREQGYDEDAADAAAEAERERIQQELDRLNAAYEEAFGFRYCVFVAGRPRVALVPEMEAALRKDRLEEIHRALDAVVDIAADRYAKLAG
jgi:2-oxo-4-hydroxy-4-carboxy-5-ureidoimidazoline decarboxylase